MTDVALSETQLEKILVAINALHSAGWWWQWVPVALVFVSALLAMLVGICIETYKASVSVKREETERDKSEISQINIAISAISYNITTLIHVATQHLLPHYKDSHAAYTALHEAGTDSEKLERLATSMSFHTYPALVTICPEIHFVEIDFFKEMPFIVEKDPELLMKTGWLISHSRDLIAAIKNRNETIIGANRTTSQQGGLKYAQIHGMLHLQRSIADAECLIASQLFDVMIDVEKILESINATYKIKGKKFKMTASKQLENVMEQLHEIAKSTESQPTTTPSA